MFIGAHLSTKDGFGKLPENARKLGLVTYQFFSKNQMQWKGKIINEEEAKLHRENMVKYDIKMPAIHASYLLNLGSPEEDKLKRSYGAFLDEIERAEKLGVERLVFHPGAHMGSGEKVALDRIVESINDAAESTRGYRTRMLIENTAGQGSVVGYSLEHLSYILDHVSRKERIGFCIDTCHIFQAGYDISHDYDGVMNQIDSQIGLNNVLAFHLNDSKYAFNRHLDRHENLGKGVLSKEFYVQLFGSKKLEKVPCYLETPEGEEGYPKDLEFLRSLGISL